jgi:hypothetical protein
MMKRARRWFTALLAIALLMPAVPAFAAPQPTTVTGKGMMHFIVDGTEYAPPEDAIGGFIYQGGYTYVPLRFVAYILGKDVNWNGEAKRVSIYEPATSAAKDRVEAFREAQKVAESVIEPVTAVTKDVLQIDVVPEVSYVIDGVSVQPAAETPGLMVSNRIYVPLRFVAENLGYRVVWDGKTYSINMSLSEEDRIVKKYRALLAEKRKEIQDEAFDLLEAHGVTLIDLNLNRVSDNQLAELRSVAAVRLPEIEQQIDEFIGAMEDELKAANASTEQAQKMRTELENLLKTIRNALKMP